MAQELTPATFLEWFPEFKDIEAAVIARTIMFNNRTYPERVWCKDWPWVVALVTAHQLAIRYDISQATGGEGINDPVGSLAGITSSMSASSNSLSESFAVSQLLTSSDPEEAYWARTEYGLQYLLMLYRLPVSSVVYSPDTSDTLGR